MKRRKTTDDLANELERQSSEDADMWQQEPTQVEARPTRTSVLSLRLPTREFHALLRAARAAGESVSEYVRKAIAMRQALEPMASTVNIAYTVLSEGPEKAHYEAHRTTHDAEFAMYRRTYTAGNPQPEPVPSY